MLKGDVRPISKQFPTETAGRRPVQMASVKSSLCGRQDENRIAKHYRTVYYSCDYPSEEGRQPGKSERE